MSIQNNVFQPGMILHEVIVGALRTNGTNFQKWCADNGLSVAAARNVTFGQSAGPRSRVVLDRLIDAAGRDVVIAAYRARMDAEARKLAQVA